MLVYNDIQDTIYIGSLSVIVIHFISAAEAEILIKIFLQCIVAGATVYKLLKSKEEKKDKEPEPE